MSTPYGVDENGAPFVYPRTCPGCAWNLNKTAYNQHQKFGCSSKSLNETSDLLVKCPSCDEAFRTQRWMVEHYHEEHGECLFSNKILPSFHAVEVLCDSIKGKTGLGLTCDKSNGTVKIYRCSGRKLTDFQGKLKTCTAFVHANSRNDGQIHVSYCETHSHPIPKNYVTYPLAALEITERMAEEGCRASEIAKAIQDFARAVPEEERNFNHECMEEMNTTKVCKYLYSRRKRQNKRSRGKHRFLFPEDSDEEVMDDDESPQESQDVPVKRVYPGLKEHDYLKTEEDQESINFELPRGFILPLDTMNFEQEMTHLGGLSDDVKQLLGEDLEKLLQLNTMLQETRQGLKRRYRQWFILKRKKERETEASCSKNWSLAPLKYSYPSPLYPPKKPHPGIKAYDSCDTSAPSTSKYSSNQESYPSPLFQDVKQELEEDQKGTFYSELTVKRRRDY